MRSNIRGDYSNITELPLLSLILRSYTVWIVLFAHWHIARLYKFILCSFIDALHFL